uniref:CSON012228 protein n=1 Tax=Culicoides sonorensis TaxID=179676 RepID=A0A336KJ48_CULSO
MLISITFKPRTNSNVLEYFMTSLVLEHIHFRTHLLHIYM